MVHPIKVNVDWMKTFLTTNLHMILLSNLVVDGHVEDGEGEHGDDAVGDHVDVDEIYLDIPTI